MTSHVYSGIMSDSDPVVKTRMFPSTRSCGCAGMKRKKVFPDKKQKGRFDTHQVCQLKDCPVKQCTNEHLRDSFLYDEWEERAKEIESKIDETETLHLSMLMLSIRVYMYALTGKVKGLNATRMRKAYSRFKLLLDSFTSTEFCVELLKRFSVSDDCTIALLARAWIRSHVMQQHHEAAQIVTLLIDNHALSAEEACFAHFTKGRLEHLFLGDVDMALKDYNASIALSTQFSDVYNNRGNLYVDFFGEVESALKDYNQAIDMDPGFCLAYNNRGNLYEEDYKDVQRALDDYTSALKCNPKYMSAHQNRVNLLFRIEKMTMKGNM